jgi:hypothetical protein
LVLSDLPAAALARGRTVPRNGARSIGAAQRVNHGAIDKIAMSTRFLALALLCLLASPAALALDYNIMLQIANRIRLLVNASNQPKNDALLHAAYARLSFHDCTGPGGCDGCINLKLGENNGLAAPIAVLEGFYNGTFMKLTRTQISRADLWQLASLVSLQYAVAIDGPAGYISKSLSLDAFKWGRKDCPTSPHAPTETAEDFPMSIVGYQPTVNFFQQRFGFNPKQTLALMGVHSLGNAKRRNSGFAGAWSHKREALSNRYYNHLTDFSWTQMAINQVGGRPSGPPVGRWLRPPPGPAAT